MMKYTLSAAFMAPRPKPEPIEATHEAQTAFHREGVTEFYMDRQEIRIISLRFTASPRAHENGAIRPELLAAGQRLILSQIRAKYGITKNIKFKLENE